jgi:2-iminobutanoate/2-iminopropanoate deaminase
MATVNDGPMAVTPHGAEPLGAYSPGCAVAGLLAVSGQVAVDPSTRSVLHPGDVVAQTRAVLHRVDAVLAAAGTDRSRLFRIGIYLARAADFSEVDRVYADWLGSARPARTTIVVELPLPGLLVEIDGLAQLPHGA